MKFRIIFLLCLISLFYSFLSCSKVPYTDRNQLTLIPESTLVEMGLVNYREFLDTMPLSTNVALTNQLRNIGDNISSAVENYLNSNGLSDRLEYFNWEYNLVDYDVPNAWCMPGGKICFYTGILPYTRDIDGIAVVMGHEIAHAVARHGSERMTQQLLLVAGGIVLSEFIKTKPAETQIAFLTAYNVGTQLGIILPYSRKHEYEADKLGLIFMAMAGYNPEEAINFWTRMSEMSGGSSVPQFLSTHPSDENRIANLRKILPEAMVYYNNSK